MTSADVKKIIGRLLADDAFATQFGCDPEACLSQYQLTDAEKAALRSIDVSQIEKAHITILKDLHGASVVMVPTLFSS